MIEGWENVRKLREELKTEWDELWRTRYDDDVLAEGVSRSGFKRLFVDQGEVISATKDFKPLSFREILERHVGSDAAGKAYPDPSVGGWHKFVKEHIPISKPVKRREPPIIKVDLSQHQRKGGQGWLNNARIHKRIRLSRYVE